MRSNEYTIHAIDIYQKLDELIVELSILKFPEGINVRKMLRATREEIYKYSIERYTTRARGDFGSTAATSNSGPASRIISIFNSSG